MKVHDRENERREARVEGTGTEQRRREEQTGQHRHARAGQKGFPEKTGRGLPTFRALRKIGADPEILSRMGHGEPGRREDELNLPRLEEAPREDRNGREESLRDQQGRNRTRPPARGPDTRERRREGADVEKGRRGQEHERVLAEERGKQKPGHIGAPKRPRRKDHGGGSRGRLDVLDGDQRREHERSVEQPFGDGVDRNALTPQEHRYEAVVLGREMPRAPGEERRDQGGREPVLAGRRHEEEQESDRYVDGEEYVLDPVFAAFVQPDERRSIVGRIDRQPQDHHQSERPAGETRRR